MSLRTVLAAVAGAVTLFVLGYVTYVVILGDFFAAHGAEVAGEPVFWAIFAGELATASLLTFIFDKWASISTLAGGFKGGAIVGALVALAVGLIQFGAMGAGDLTAVVADTVVSAVRVGIAGAVVGMMLGRK